MDRLSHPDAALVQRRCSEWLGLALRARRLAVGSDAVLAAVRSRKARLVVLAADAGERAKKQFRDKCAFYHIPLFEVLNRGDLGRAIGRSEVVAVAVTDPGFAAKLRELLGEIDGGEAFDKTPRV
ncbi:hypothetical protein GCM10010885_00010 [Alicyclobacillus cellulosilyticus]|uniref:Ribosomal protein eL8/eL30/eS12/Gadd45 domain-containing protein n=1 Tax=Alicyclobacillus cellulosilyticus TaxID=1003997 RepID=A0A917K230_9BACL|nr:ribosomal L7Ae/L30e/S12e/Gadd45 family protein [Alicyclobacillus cellulosilyticus]GGI94506.1 hypothetical protein GCM10010885_00010 [Alicyclobacillus cellulosilyticus]